MRLADALARVTLRPCSGDDGGAAGDASPATLVGEVARERARNARLRACDLEAWYDRLAPYTFRTTFVSITPEEARAMLAAYRAKKRGSGAEASAEHRALLAALENRIAEAMVVLLGRDTERGVFAKLSSRSPKDSRLCEARALAKVKERLLAHRASGGIVDTNTVLTATMGCGIQALRLTTASDVLECFLTSERVCEDDLPLALGFPDRWSQHIVLREWVTIPTHHEFRGFVIDNELTALSQYFSGAYFPELVERKDRMLELVRSCFVDIRDRVGLDPADYVLDFAVDPNSTGRVFVIELNPFGRPDGLGTGTPLFDMSLPEDRAVLFGEAPFEFRIETKPSGTAMKTLLRDGPLKEWLLEQDMLPK